MRYSYKKKIRRIMAVILSGVVSLSLCSGCQQWNKKEDTDSFKDIKVETRTIDTGTLEIRTQYIGTVSPNITIDVVPYVSGKVEKVKVKVGDKVKAGQLLCQLDDTPADLQVKSAEDAVNSAEAGKEAAEEQMVSARIQANSSVRTLKNALKGYRDSLKTVRNQLNKLKKSRKSMIKAQNLAKKTYGDAAKQYKTAQNILVQFEAFLDQNPDCKTTAGLMMAASPVSSNPDDYTATPDPSTTNVPADATVTPNPPAGNDPSPGDGESSTADHGTGEPGSDSNVPDPSSANPPSGNNGSGNSNGTAKVDKQKQRQAQALQKILADTGLTVEYISATGVNSLKENADEGKNAFTNAAAGLSQLDASIGTMKTNIEQLKAQIKSSEDSLASARKLADAADVGTGVYDAQIAAAETGVDAARYQKDMYRLTAPIDGVVDAVNVKEKGNAAQGYAAFTISEKESMIATFYVTEEVKNFLRPGHEVLLENEDDKKSPPVTGMITMIGTSTDPQKGLFKVEAEIFTTGQKKLSGGVNVKLSVVSNAVADQLLIPYDAVYYEDGQAYVYVYTDGKAVRRDVETGLFNEDQIAITQGLNAGDAVITTWASGLKDGAKVEIIDEEDKQ